MGRIEDALRKLERQHVASTRSVGDNRMAPRKAELGRKDFSVIDFDAVTRQVPVDSSVLAKSGLVRTHGDKDSARREYGRIKRPVLDLAIGRGMDRAAAGNVVLVTSAVAGEGKSLTTVNLAISIARDKDWQVLLIDADAIKPELSRTFGLESESGFADLVADDDMQLSGVVWKTFVDRLYFMPAGTRLDEASELFGSRRMAQLVEFFDREMPNTLVIIDSSPLLLTNESPLLAKTAGQIVFVVRANKTPRLVVDAALDLIDPSKPTGCVLNGISNPEFASYSGAYEYGDASSVSDNPSAARPNASG